MITAVALVGYLVGAPASEGATGSPAPASAAGAPAGEPRPVDLCTWFRPYGAGLVYDSEVIFRYREDVNLTCAVAYSAYDCYRYASTAPTTEHLERAHRHPPGVVLHVSRG